ncbi:MAG TPA: adenylate/guanylate cyclase domain-containing protein, partial [Allocoleopsis sp.]
MTLKFLSAIKGDRLLQGIFTLPKQWRQHLQNLPVQIPAGITVVGLISLGMTGLIGGIEQVGGIEPLELRAYDWMIRLRPAEQPDPRLLVVTITEADIREQQQSILSDQVIAETLAILEQHQPVAIGLDLYRDVPQPPGTAALQRQLASLNLIAITNLGTTDADYIPSPPTVPIDRVGFNDFPVDADGVVRRSLLFGGDFPSFSLQLAWKYLATQGIFSTPSPIDPTLIQLDTVTVLPLQSHTGGYQTIDARGYQLLLNYRNHQPVAREITLSQVLHHQFQPAWIQGKVVLIGTTAPSRKDLFYTPFSAGQSSEHQMPGVEIHAQMLSQILSAVLDRRPLIWSIPEWMDWLWIALWAGIGGGLAWWIHRPIRLGATCVGVLLLLGITAVGVFQGAGWLPVISPALATLLTIGTVVAYRAQQAHHQHQMVMTLLGQNTSKEIANALWQNRDTLINSGKLPGQRLIATMLFTDIRGFSTISESMPPEALLEWLNEYLEAMIQEIQRYQGITNKFTG